MGMDINERVDECANLLNLPPEEIAMLTVANRIALAQAKGTVMLVEVFARSEIGRPLSSRGRNRYPS